MTIRAAALLAMGAAAAAAHGPLHEQIERVTAEIKRQPSDARLYLKRGDLHRLHEEWKQSEADLDRAAQLDPSLAEVNLIRGRLWLDAGQPDNALAALDRYVKARPSDPEGFATRGQAHEKSGQHHAAALDYDRANRNRSPEVDLVIASARAWQAAGESETALARLNSGIHALGPLVTLESAAIEIETGLKRWDEALARIEVASRQSSRKEQWLARRARILDQAGRPAEARDAWAAALAALEALQDRLRRQPATAQLEAEVRAALVRPR